MRQGASAKELIIPKISLDGLADHDRNGEFTPGNVSLEYETILADYDRDRRFTVDAMDNAESAGVAFGSLAAAFIREKVVPELDAYRMASYAGLAGLSESGALAGGEAVLTALIAAQNAQDEAEVPSEDRVLFITPTLYNAVANVDTTKSKAVLASYGTIKKIPQTRFYSAIDLLDGKSSGEEAGHFQKAADAKNLNFMSVSRSAVIQHQKHTVSKVISPEDNQNGDAWIFLYRTYGMAKVYENKKNGIYVHTAV